MKTDKAVMSAFSLALVFFTAFVAFPATTFGQAESCVTAKCHSSLGEDKVVHNPVKEGMCATCHQAVPETQKKTKHPGNLTITLMQQGADLCAMCHEPKNKKKVVHAPILAGDCTSCHNPHQSANKGMLRKPMPGICFGCHPESIVKNAVVHPPLAGGDCSGCHDNHQSDFPNRLQQQGNAVCFLCHPDKEEGIKTGKSVHNPVKQGCTLCHSPHSSPNPAMTSAPVPQLCFNCHPTEAASGQKSSTKHSPVMDGKKCMNCHDVHFAGQPGLLPKQEADLCLGCHAAEMPTKRGAIMNMQAFLEANKDRHGPLKEGNCSQCHNPHGSDFWRMLVKYYPPDFYTAYSEGKYALCFTCHQKAAFAELRTKRATGFRDGDRNLHFLHVNKAAKGRTCGACHDVHASSGLPHHLKETITFSGWEMPINFAPAKNGGSCAPGCHGEKTYTR